MKKAFILILFGVFFLSNNYILAQNAKVKDGIKDGISDLFSELRSAEDINESKSSLVSQFQKIANGFTFNGREQTFEHFLNEYARSLGNYRVNHKLEDISITPSKTKGATEMYDVNAVLVREIAGPNPDKALIANSPVTFQVRWNSDGLGIYGITIEKPLKFVTPETEVRWEFDVNKGTSKISCDAKEERKIKVPVLSLRKKYIVYKGIKQTLVSEEAVPVEIIKGKDRKNLSLNSKGQTTIEFTSPVNYSTQTVKEETIEFIQSESQNKFVLTIAANPLIKPTFKDRLEHAFSCSDDYDSRFGFELIYDTKYTLGASLWLRPEDTRWWIGFQYSANWISDGNKNEAIYVNKDKGESVCITNGYRINRTSYRPSSNDKYSTEYDPYNDALRKDHRCLMLFNLGLQLKDWLRLDLGTGASLLRQVYSMDYWPNVTVYSYTPLHAGLPEIPDQIVVKKSETKIDFKPTSTWNFALRPGLTFRIPVGEKFLHLGFGYTIIPKMITENSVGLSVGFSI